MQPRQPNTLNSWKEICRNLAQGRANEEESKAHRNHNGTRSASAVGIAGIAEVRNHVCSVSS
jgi:hypothetical protein